MNQTELIAALERLKVETGSLACLAILRAIHTAVPPVITKERAGPRCRGCPWRQKGQLCVWPRGVCTLRR